MHLLPDFLLSLSTLPLERLHALIALGGLGVAALAIYVVFVVTTDLKR